MIKVSQLVPSGGRELWGLRETFGVPGLVDTSLPCLPHLQEASMCLCLLLLRGHRSLDSGPYFPINSHSEVPGGHEFGGHSSSQ